MSTCSFQDFLLKPELLHVIKEYGSEAPSKVQQELIPPAMLGKDVVCQAKSGMGKTFIYILATVQQLEPMKEQISVVVLCHTRELAFGISSEYKRFCKYMPAVKISLFYGGLSMKTHEDILKNNCPHIAIGTPGRILALARSKALNLQYVKYFIVDACDKLLESLDTRRDVLEIFKTTPHEKQVVMCTANLNEEIVSLCKKFMRNPLETTTIAVSKSKSHDLRHYYIELCEDEKDQKLIDLLGKLQFNRTVIFVESVMHCVSVCQLLMKENFAAVAIHQEMTHQQEFKELQRRILVATNSLRRTMDTRHVDIVLNYDTPVNSDIYLYAVGHLGHSGTKGLVITFISDESDAAILNEIQRRFEIDIIEMRDENDIATYMKKCSKHKMCESVMRTALFE